MKAVILSVCALTAAACEVSSQSPLALEARTSMAATLVPYETIRAALARDQTEGVSDAARALAGAAVGAQASVPATAKAQLARLAVAAADLASAGGDLEESRARFGEVSRPLVALLSLLPELAKGRHVFECGMTQGYGKWVQASAEVQNPYMGTQMLTCGSASTWKE